MTTAPNRLPPGRDPTRKNARIKGDGASWLGIAVAGYILIFFTFGVLGLWAAVAKIDRAVAAPGVVSIETNRKTVEHFEGGMVREILVKEGQAVEKGATLFRLENIEAKASFETLQHELDAFLAVEARLMAERDQKTEITWPRDLVQRSDEVSVKQVTSDETAEFNKRKSSLDGQTDVLQSRITQIGDEIHGAELQKQSAEGQIDFINKELVGLRELEEKKLIPVARLYAAEIERERLQGVIGASIAQIAKSNGEIGEYKIQIQQLQQRFQEEVAKTLADVRDKIVEFRAKLDVAKDVLRRVDVLAPVSGTAQNLKVFTIGQVVKGGEPLVDIVPGSERLIVEARISPTDIDGIHSGQDAEVRFPAFHSRLIPLIVGRLESGFARPLDRRCDEAILLPRNREPRRNADPAGTAAAGPGGHAGGGIGGHRRANRSKLRDSAAGFDPAPGLYRLDRTICISVDRRRHCERSEAIQDHRSFERTPPYATHWNGRAPPFRSPSPQRVSGDLDVTNEDLATSGARSYERVMMTGVSDANRRRHHEICASMAVRDKFECGIRLLAFGKVIITSPARSFHKQRAAGLVERQSRCVHEVDDVPDMPVVHGSIREFRGIGQIPVSHGSPRT